MDGIKGVGENYPPHGRGVLLFLTPFVQKGLRIIIIYFDSSPCNAGRCFISMQNPATAGGGSYLLRQSLLIIRFWQEERKVGRYNGKRKTLRVI